MKIALYYPWIYLTSGVERTILETVKRSKDEYVIFTNRYEPENTFPGFKKLKVVELSRIPVRRDLMSVIRAAVTITLQKIDLSGFDRLVVHSEGLGDLILVRNSGLAALCYCHTPLRPVFDESYRSENLKSKNFFRKAIFYFFAFAFKSLDRTLWSKYRYIIFNSRESLRRAIKGGLVRETDKRLKIIHPGVDTSSIKPSLIYREYFFHPGRIMWTKNISLSINAFKKFKENNKFRNYRLVVAGRVDEKSKTYLRELKKLSIKRKDIVFIENPDDSKMNSLYRDCRLVLMTSYNEDWGITLLEGNAFGKPAIAVNKGGPSESQINGKTGFLVEADINEVAEQMTVLAGNLNKCRLMGKQARKNSLKYSWDKFSRQFSKVMTLG